MTFPQRGRAQDMGKRAIEVELLLLVRFFARIRDLGDSYRLGESWGVSKQGYPARSSL